MQTETRCHTVLRNTYCSPVKPFNPLITYLFLTYRQKPQIWAKPVVNIADKQASYLAVCADTARDAGQIK